MLSRTACGRPGTLSVWETWKPRPGGCPKFRTVGTSMYLYMHDTYWYVLAGVRVYDVGGALAMASAVQGATIRQRRPRHAARASAHLPRLRLPSNSCWSSSRPGSRALWGGDTRRDRRVRVTRNTRRVGAYGRSGWFIVGGEAGAATRRDSNRGRGIGRLDETMSPVARGRVLSRIMIWRFLGIILLSPAKASQS